jgi:hypothetical protein
MRSGGRNKGEAKNHFKYEEKRKNLVDGSTGTSFLWSCTFCLVFKSEAKNFQETRALVGGGAGVVPRQQRDGPSQPDLRWLLAASDGERVCERAPVCDHVVARWH